MAGEAVGATGVLVGVKVGVGVLPGDPRHPAHISPGMIRRFSPTPAGTGAIAWVPVCALPDAVAITPRSTPSQRGDELSVDDIDDALEAVRGGGDS